MIGSQAGIRPLEFVGTQAKGNDMQRYSNLSGESGVIAFGIRDGAILVEFHDQSLYLYNTEKPGTAALAQLQKLANAGQGLNSYITRHIGKNYFDKIR